MVKTTKDVTQANVITHDGSIHGDETFATAIREKCNKDEDVIVYRTSKLPESIGKDVIVYDIGGGKFDHHQKGKNGMRENGVYYAACGLMWKEFGPQILANTCNPELVWNLVDRELIQGIDAVDNGDMPKANYPAQAMNISQIIGLYNPNWDSEDDSDKAFVEAVALAKTVLERTIANAISIANAQKIVYDAIEVSEDHILILSQSLPWEEFIFSSTNEKAKEILIAIYPSSRGGYTWKCVPDELGSCGQRKPVPSEWKGLRDSELQKVTGVTGAISCHPNGFRGSAKTFEDALALAKLIVNA